MVPNPAASIYSVPLSCARSLVASLYYILVSVLLTLCNKILFERFPSVDPSIVVLGQAITSVIAFLLALSSQRISLPPARAFRRRASLLFCLFLLSHAATLLSALLALRLTSLLMCNTLRRTSIVFVIGAQALASRAVPSGHTLLAAALVVSGALYAARADLRFDARGYALALVANVSSSIYLVLVRPVRDALCVSNTQLQLLTAVFVVPLQAAVVSVRVGLPEALSVVRAASRDARFAPWFACSCGLALMITHATYVNTTVNSAVTHVVSALMKDTALFFLSLVLDDVGDRAPGNLVGVLLSLCGSLVYGIGRLDREIQKRNKDGRMPRSDETGQRRAPAIDDSIVEKKEL